MRTSSPAGRLRDFRPSILLNRYVVAAFLLQTLSYAVLLGVLAHGDVTPLVALLRGLPVVVAAALGLFAVPALALTVALGAAVEFLLGISLQGVGTGVVSGDDLPFLAVAYLLSVGVGELVSRWR